MKYVAYLALMFGAAPVVAQTVPSAASAPVAPAATKTADRVICRTIEETGTRLGGKRVCMTQLQWEEQRREAREDTEEGLRHKH